MPGIGAVILAAGASTRLGTPKQLVRFQGRSLLRRAAEETLAAGCRPVVVVLGACWEPAIRELSGLLVHVTENRDWREGMASSVRTGMEALSRFPGAFEPEGLLLAVCDQPHYSQDLVARLIQAYRNSNGSLTASRYANTLGVPAIFPNSLFPDLCALRGEEGARKVIRANSGAASTVPFPEGTLDIDTPEDCERLCNRTGTRIQAGTGQQGKLRGTRG